MDTVSPFLDFLWLHSKLLPVGFTIVPTVLGIISPSCFHHWFHPFGQCSLSRCWGDTGRHEGIQGPTCRGYAVLCLDPTSWRAEQPLHTCPAQSPVSKRLTSSLYSKGTSVLGRLSHTHGQHAENQHASKLGLDQISERRGSYTYSP